MVLSVRLLKFADLAQVSWKLLLLVRELKLLAVEKREADWQTHSNLKYQIFSARPGPSLNQKYAMKVHYTHFRERHYFHLARKQLREYSN